MTIFQSMPNYHDPRDACKADHVNDGRGNGAHPVARFEHNTDMRSLSERLLDARNAKGWSQAELAKAAGCSQSLIGNLEAGRQKGTTKLAAIASALGVTPLWLEQGKGPKTAESSEALPEVRETGIDAQFLSRCLTATDAFLAKAKRTASQDERVSFAVDLYSVFHGQDATVDMMRTFLERWEARIRAKER